MKNKELAYYLFGASVNVIMIFSNGAIIQAFLALIGLLPDQIGIYSFCVYATQMIALIISSFCVDKIKNIPKTTAIFTLPSLLFFAIMIFLSIFDQIEINSMFVITLIACSFWNFFYGLIIAVYYKLPYYIVDIAEYPRVLNSLGIIRNTLGVLISGMFVFLTKIFDYQKVILVCFVIASIFKLLAFLSVYSIKNRMMVNEEKENKKISLGILSLKATRWFVLPNVMRGISTGIMGMATVIMLSTITKDISLSSSPTVIFSLASILSCTFYSKIYRHIKTVNLAILGSIIQCVGLVFLVLGNTTVFFIMYFIACFGLVIVDFAVPIYVTQIIPYEYVGGYTAMSTLFYTIGTAIGSYISGILVTDKVFILLVICGVSQITHVVSYALYERLYSRDKF